jgi:hypothetical protein
MAKRTRWTGTVGNKVDVMSKADFPRIRPLESRVLGNLHARFGGGRLEKVLKPVGRHCCCKRTHKRTPVQTENLASRLPYMEKGSQSVDLHCLCIRTSK